MLSVRIPHLLLAVFLLAQPAIAQARGNVDTHERTPIATSPHFAFYSNLDTNLNDALIAAGVARRFKNPELFRDTDSTCFNKLSPTTRQNWEEAADYYSKNISPGGFGDRQQMLIRFQLAGFKEEITTTAAQQYVDTVRNIRVLATAAYKACHWNAQDERNKKWIANLQTLLRAHEQKIGTQLEHLYQLHWNNLPIPVDVVETVDWSGANTIFRHNTDGHILISTSYQGPSALEGVFHEASHLLMGRAAPIQLALDSAARAANYHAANDLWHVVLFFTTGEVVRGILDDANSNSNAPPYTPMLYDIMKRGTWANYRPSLESQWSPYVAGKVSLSKAATALIDRVRSLPTKSH
ncbi:MAG: hypothetical protein ABJB66_05905 [Gemmatimonadaceae bacterium]